MRIKTAISGSLLLACDACAHFRGGDSATLAIVGATVVHPGRGEGAVERDATVLIQGDRIVGVGPSATTELPRGATVLDAQGKWLIPGLIDSHVHFHQSGNLYTRPDQADLTFVVPYAAETARNHARLPATFKVWLASGVTGVADVGGPFWNFEVREAARRSETAPHAAVAGPLLSTVARPQLDVGDPPILKVASVEEARALARKELDRRPDFVKVWFIRGSAGEHVALGAQVVRVAAEEAHARGIRLAVHATELETAKAALQGGADILVHSVTDQPVDAEFLALAKERKVLYIPTLFVRMGYQLALSGQWQPTQEEKRLADPEILAAMGGLDKLPRDKLPTRVRDLMDAHAPVEPSPTALENLRAVHQADIAVAMGTDAGNIGTLHGPSVFREMDLMVRAGLTPAQVLACATVGGGRMLGMERDLGDVAAGKLADLVLLDGDPLADIANVRRVSRVVRAGRVLDPSQLMESIR